MQDFIGRPGTPAPENSRRFALTALWAVAVFTVGGATVGCGHGKVATTPLALPALMALDKGTQHSPSASLPARDDLVHRLILIGDAGDPAPLESALVSLGRWGDAAPEQTTVLFLGDNLYPAGLDAHDPARGKAILRRQVEATTASKIFLAGNHDWGSPRRVSTVEREEAYLESFGPTTDFLPKHGCPGPVARTLAPAGELAKPLTVIFIDLQWWHLDRDERPPCGAIETEADLLAALSAELEMRRDEWVIVASHRPIRSAGPHGTQPVASTGNSLSAWTRGILHLGGPWYVEALGRIANAMAAAPPLAAVGGHDHSLQVIQGGAAARYVIVSGAGAETKITGVTAIEGTYFAHAKTGFIVIDFRRTPSGDLVTAVVVESERDNPVFAMDLAEPATR